jgi:hypothetical protein
VYIRRPHFLAKRGELRVGAPPRALAFPAAPRILRATTYQRWYYSPPVAFRHPPPRTIAKWNCTEWVSMQRNGINVGAVQYG